MKRRFHIEVRTSDGWVYVLMKPNPLDPRKNYPREYTRKEAEHAVEVLSKYGRNKAIYTIIKKE